MRRRGDAHQGGVRGAVAPTDLMRKFQGLQIISKHMVWAIDASKLYVLKLFLNLIFNLIFNRALGGQGS